LSDLLVGSRQDSPAVPLFHFKSRSRTEAAARLKNIKNKEDLFGGGAP